MSKPDKWLKGDNGATTGIDKRALYGENAAETRARNRFVRRLAYKSVDMPEDDTNINANKYGFGWKELAVIGGLVVGGLYLLRDEPPAVSPPPAATSPVNSEYDVLFYDADGNPIAVPHVSSRPE